MARLKAGLILAVMLMSGLLLVVTQTWYYQDYAEAPRGLPTATQPVKQVKTTIVSSTSVLATSPLSTGHQQRQHQPSIPRGLPTATQPVKQVKTTIVSSTSVLANSSLSTGHQQRQHQPSDESTECKDKFYNSFHDNLNVVANYPKGVADKYSSIILSNLKQPKLMPSVPVIVTGADSKYYVHSQGMLKSLHDVLMPRYIDLKIIFYDLGLLPDQLDELKQHCQCEVRAFPFEELPDHVRHLKGYAFKPIVVQRTLMEFGLVWWVDTSVRFRTSELESAIAYANKTGMLFITENHHLVTQTDLQTMQYLNEDVCKFKRFGEVHAAYLLFSFNDVTKIVVDAWAACALTEQCILPPGALDKIDCGALGCIGKIKPGCCHRYDQSIISIIYRRLYHDKDVYPEANDRLRRVIAYQHKENKIYFTNKQIISNVNSTN